MPTFFIISLWRTLNYLPVGFEQTLREIEHMIQIDSYLGANTFCMWKIGVFVFWYSDLFIPLLKLRNSHSINISFYIKWNKDECYNISTKLVRIGLVSRYHWIAKWKDNHCFSCKICKGGSLKVGNLGGT